MLGQHRISGRLLASEIGECLVDKRLLSGRSFEVGITRPVQPRRRIPRQNPAAPIPLHLGKMTEQSKQRHRRRRHRPTGQLLRVQPLTLHLQGQSIIPQVGLQRRQLAVRAHSLTVARILFRVHPHVREHGGPAPPLGQVNHHTDSAQQLSQVQLDIRAAGNPPGVGSCTNLRISLCAVPGRQHRVGHGPNPAPGGAPVIIHEVPTTH